MFYKTMILQTPLTLISKNYTSKTLIITNKPHYRYENLADKIISISILIKKLRTQIARNRFNRNEHMRHEFIAI